MSTDDKTGVRVRWLVTGAFTARPAGRRFHISPNTFASTLEATGLTFEATVPDRLGDGATRSYPVAFGSLKAFQANELIAAVPALAGLTALGAALAQTDATKRPDPVTAVAKVIELVGDGKLAAALKTKLNLAAPAAPAPAPPAPVVSPAPPPFQLTPWQPKPAYKVKYPKGPSPQAAFAFAAPPPGAKGKVKAAVAAALAAPDLSDVIVLDTETTGIGSSARIVEVAALHVKNGVVVRQFQSLVNPEMHIPSVVVRVHGITDAMVVGAPTAAPVLSGFAKFVAGHTLVAHNASFDFGILRGEYGRVKVAPPGCAMYCSVKLARVVFPEAPNHKLGTLATFLKLPHPPTHRALADCFTTMALLNAMAARKKSHQAVRLVGRSYDL
ncbi:MAG: hypothetical protein JWM10_4957 [Myxococcaceae bacterium]|nr:hypothetical protein [Myxococcaceae bacterium]